MGIVSPRRSLTHFLIPLLMSKRALLTRSTYPFQALLIPNTKTSQTCNSPSRLSFSSLFLSPVSEPPFTGIIAICHHYRVPQYPRRLLSPVRYQILLCTEWTRTGESLTSSSRNPGGFLTAPITAPTEPPAHLCVCHTAQNRFMDIH